MLFSRALQFAAKRRLFPRFDCRLLSSAMSDGKPKIAVAQICSTSDFDGNFQQCRAAALAAKEQKAALLSLPECFEFMGLPGSGDAIAAAQPLSGDLFSRYKDLAKETGIWLSLGGFHESSETPSKIYNTHVIVSSDGDIVASYHKLHLFDVDVDGGFKVINKGNTGS